MKDILALDTETTGLGPKDRAFGVSWSHRELGSGYVDFRVDDPTPFVEVVTKTDCPIACHNGSFDYRMLANAGYKIPMDRLDDTVIRATLINEHEYDYSLDALAKKHLGKEKEREIYAEMAELFGGRATRSAQMGRISEAPRDSVAKYAIPDAIIARELWEWQEAEIERQGIEEITAFERRVMPHIIRNEMKGVRVDEQLAHDSVAKIEAIIGAQSKQLFDVVGKKFNFNSSKDMEDVFKPYREDGVWYTKDGHPIPSTPGGKASFSADSLREIDSPVAKAIIDLRSLDKTRGTFLEGHILRNAIDGRVYPSIHQTKGEDGGTGTGRFSYTTPALQQIPSRNKAVAAILKPIFLPDEGQVWVDADMHSFEVRVFAHLVNEAEIIRQYAEKPDSDFHQMVADMTGLPRNATYSGQANAKQLNLSMIFNSGNGAIAEKMGMPFTWDGFQKKNWRGEMEEFRYKVAGPEAMAVIDNYHERLPGVKRLATKASKLAKTFGYVETEYGRRLRFPRGEKVYKASGLAIQATAADINKMNWIIIADALGNDGRLVLNTHDSYGLSLPQEWEPSWKKVKSAVESGFPWFRVPIILELSGAGPNWWAALGK